MQMPNAQGIAGLMAQGRTPQMPQPQQPQQPGPSPMRASPMAGLGSVEERVAAYRGNPAPLQQRYAMSQDLLDLLALQKIKSEKDAAARQMQMQMAQQQAAQGMEPMTVAQQREKEVMEMTKNELAQQRGETAQQQMSEQQANLQRLMGGIARAPGAQAAAQPKAMAAGGIVAFAGGGQALDQARERRKAAQEKLYSYGLRQRQQDPEGYQAAQEELRSAEAALQEAQKSYSAETSAAGLDRPVMSRQDMGAAGRFQRQEEAAASAAYPDESTRGFTGAVDPTAAAAPAARLPAPPAAAPQAGLGSLPVQRPTAPPPAMPTAPTAPAGPAAPAAPSMPPVSMIPGLKESIAADVGRDPEAAQRAQEDRIRAAFALSPEQRKVYEEGIAERQRMLRETYDPERQRQEGLKRFLIGAGGRRYGEFGAGAGAGLAYDEAQRAQRLKDFEAMQKSREGLVSLEREGIKPSIEGGLKSLEATGALRRQGQASGANIFGTETSAATSKYSTDVKSRDDALNREIERAKIAAQAAATAVQREGLDFSRMQGHLNSIISNRARAVEAVHKRFATKLSMLEMQLQTAPNDKKLQEAKTALGLEIQKAVDDETKEFDDAKAIVESRMFGSSGGTGGYTVRKKEAPTR